MKLVDLEYDEIKHETEKAYLFVIDGKDVWLPKSVVQVNETDKEVTMPESMAIDKELV
jgi:hypothetical protein